MPKNIKTAIWFVSDAGIIKKKHIVTGMLCPECSKPVGIDTSATIHITKGTLPQGKRLNAKK